MKNIIIQKVLPTGIIVLIFACNSIKEKEPGIGVVDKEQIKKEIQTKENEFATTYNTRKLKNINYYAHNATSFYQNRAPLVDKDTIIEFLRSNLASNSNKISFKTNEVFVSNDDKQIVEIG